MTKMVHAMEEKGTPGRWKAQLPKVCSACEGKKTIGVPTPSQPRFLHQLTMERGEVSAAGWEKQKQTVQTNNHAILPPRELSDSQKIGNRCSSAEDALRQEKGRGVKSRDARRRPIF